ncbi:MAG: SHOCT domain-containing protein [Chloroflexota bacterium]
MMNYGWDMGSSGGFWVIGGVLLMVGLVSLVVWAVNRSSSRGRSSAPAAASSSALDILRERFARGEITEQEFEQAKKTLGH